MGICFSKRATVSEWRLNLDSPRTLSTAPRCLTESTQMTFTMAQDVTNHPTFLQLRSSELRGGHFDPTLNRYSSVSSLSSVKRKQQVSSTASSSSTLPSAPAALNKGLSCPSFTCSVQTAFCVSWTVSTWPFPEVTEGTFLIRSFKTLNQHSWNMLREHREEFTPPSGKISWDKHVN